MGKSRSRKFSSVIPNFSIFILLGQKNKLKNTFVRVAGQKYAWAGSDNSPSLNLTIVVKKLLTPSCTQGILSERK